MAIHQSSLVRNRLLSALSQDDFALLEPMLERISLPLQLTLIHAGQPIQHVVFPESGIVSTIADTEEGKIEIGVIGREGLVGVPVVLGASQSLHTHFVQGTGEGLRISARDLRAAIAKRPSIFRPLGLYVQALIIQMGQTAYVNVTFNIEARLARWILMTQDRVDDDELVLTHGFLSAMLGVRRPGVTAAMHALEGMGSIRNTRGRVHVVSREKLMELAGDGYNTAELEYERLMAEA